MRSSSLIVLPMLWLAGAGGAWAAGESTHLAGSVQASMQFSGSTDGPRLSGGQFSAAADRSAPGYQAESSELSYRWWKSSGRAQLGLGLGTLTYSVRPTGSLPGLGSPASANVLAAGSVLTLGMRYRTSSTSALFADASGVRGHGFDGGRSVVGKIGIEFKAARSRFSIKYGGLGLHLAGDTRMTLRVRRGGFGIVMRSKF